MIWQPWQRRQQETRFTAVANQRPKMNQLLLLLIVGRGLELRRQGNPFGQKSGTPYSYKNLSY
jgi:hypothetical protein